MKMTLEQFNQWLKTSEIPAIAKPGNGCLWIHRIDNTMSRKEVMTRLGRIGTVSDVCCEDFVIKTDLVEMQAYQPFVL